MTPRLAARAIILHENKLLLVNAYADMRRNLWCAPGGGVEAGQSLHDNLAREVFEETGLTIAVGDPVLVNEFHDPGGTFHQVDLYFRCDIRAGALDNDWTDPEGIVKHRRFVTRDEMVGMNVKPDSLADVAWRTGAIRYDALEPIVR